MKKQYKDYTNKMWRRKRDNSIVKFSNRNIRPKLNITGYTLYRAKTVWEPLRDKKTGKVALMDKYRAFEIRKKINKKFPKMKLYISDKY